MAKVSVIVPVYNVEKYINRCIDSILNQTIQDLEIILVDDGSTDKSGKICDEYQEKDERIRVIHKKNGGLSDARNAGEKIATSEYIIFLDSDDYIHREMLETLYTPMKEKNVDLSVCGAWNVYDEEEIPQYPRIEQFLCTGSEAFKFILEGYKIPGAIWNKMIKKEIADKISFPVGRIYEDAFYTLKLIPLVKQVYVTTKPMYYYVHRQGSITTSKFKEADMDIVHAYRDTMQFVKEQHPELMPQAEFRLFWAHFVVVDRILELDNYKSNIYYQQARRFLRRNILRILKNKYFTKNRRVAAVLFFLSDKIYRKVLIKNKKQLAD